MSILLSQECGVSRDFPYSAWIEFSGIYILSKLLYGVKPCITYLIS
jgi:hypothetical protein